MAKKKPTKKNDQPELPLGSDESPAFVNGVLDRLAAELRPQEGRAVKPKAKKPRKATAAGA